MKNKEKIKKTNPHLFKTIFTYVMVILAIACLFARETLISLKPIKEEFEAQYSHDSTVSCTVMKTSPGMNISARQAVKVTSGEGFARFTVEITDSDGVSFTEKLADLQEQLDEVESYIEQDVPSIIAFKEAYHELLNEYNLTCAKYELAYKTLYKAVDEAAVKDGTLYTYEELETAVSDGTLTAPGGDDFVESYDEETPYIRTYTYTKPLESGEECVLFTNIIVPSDWQNQTVDVVQYTENEDNTFTESVMQVSCLDVIGDGFTVNVSAEAVDANGFTSYAAAFANAENPNAETVLDSSCTDSE